MGFCERLRNETKENHSKVDNHRFVELIKTDKFAMKLYLFFNMICFEYLDSYKNSTPPELLKKIVRPNKTAIITENQYKNPNNFLFSWWTTKQSNFSDKFYFIWKDTNMNELLKHIMLNSIENSYLFTFGLLYGGNIISKYMDNIFDKETAEHHKMYLKFENSNQLKNEFKEYLETISKENEEKFIETVNKSYSLIEKIFDRFVEEIKSN